MADSDAWQVQREALGAMIRAQRQLADLSLRQLADSAEISNAYLSQVERGLHEPSMRVLRSIADALGTSLDAMLRQSGIVQPDATEAAEPGLEAAINADPYLSEDQKEALVAVYRSYRSQSPQP